MPSGCFFLRVNQRIAPAHKSPLAHNEISRSHNAENLKKFHHHSIPMLPSFHSAAGSSSGRALDGMNTAASVCCRVPTPSKGIYEGLTTLPADAENINSSFQWCRPLWDHWIEAQLLGHIA